MGATSFPKEKISILLLENIHPTAAKNFESESFKVQTLPGSLGRDELAEKIDSAHVIGIRSKTNLSAQILENARRLLAIGAFCIGVNQIDLNAAAKLGIPVFNAPFSNTRSVAELIISHIISLARGIPEKNIAAHQGRWLKGIDGAREARGKTVGVIGYGHIGAQVSIMAESLGMKVIFHDIVDKLALGNAMQAQSLDQLLNESDFVTLHVPATPETAGMIDRAAISKMKKGSALINYSRGNVVDIDSLAQALLAGHLSGAAIDVFPVEPKARGQLFSSPLQGIDNVILTPHIGGSTLEAQQAIGDEVSKKLIKFINNGSTTMSVNVPEVELPIQKGKRRILHFHKNEPGAIQAVNSILAENGINIYGQHLMTKNEIGYLVMDVSEDAELATLNELKKVQSAITSRVLFAT